MGDYIFLIQPISITYSYVNNIGVSKTYVEKLNETILLPSLEINQKRMDYHMSMMEKNALFTNIMDMNTPDIIEFYRKRNRVEHCFQTINTMGIVFPVYR